MKNSSLLAASLLTLSLATAACSGSSSTADLYGTPPAPTTSGSAAANDAGPQGDGAIATVDVNAAPPLVKHCSGTVGTADVCLENAQGHAGEVVDIDVYFVGSNTCTDALEVNGRFVADGSHFALANPIQQVNCVSRDLFGAPAPGTTEIMWNAFGAGAITACPNKLTPGKLDTVKVQILPGTPPGVYPIRWSDVGIAGSTSQCSLFTQSGQSVGIGGQIRVLP